MILPMIYTFYPRYSRIISPKTRISSGFRSFIQFSPADVPAPPPSAFSWLTGVKLDDEDSVAIRPETIAISREKPNRANAYEWQGTVLESRSRGNVLRYTIDVNGIQIFADTLFRSFSIFEDQEKVWLSVEKRNCLAVADKAAKRTGYHTAAEEKKSA